MNYTFNFCENKKILRRREVCRVPGLHDPMLNRVFVHAKGVFRAAVKSSWQYEIKYDHRCTRPKRVAVKDANGNEIDCAYCKFRNEQIPSKYSRIGKAKIKRVKQSVELVCSFSGTKGIKCNWQKKVPAGSDATRLDMNDDDVKAIFKPSAHLKSQIEQEKLASAAST